MSVTVPRPEALLRDLFLFRDTCNVYLLRRGDRGVAIDFGEGRWLKRLPGLGIAGLDHVILTHHHVDQCAGLLEVKHRRFPVHAPVGDERFLKPEGVKRFWTKRRGHGCPASYSVLPRGIPRVAYDMAEARDLFWGTTRIRFLPTPGHGPHACSVILNWDGKQIVFCGDAAHAGATIHQPYHLEWDHWTAAGHLAAWNGVSRLAQVGMDLLCPSHGPIARDRPAAMLRKLRTKLRKFYESKLSICPGERDEFVPVESVGDEAERVLPHLYHFANSGYLLLSDAGEALVLDATLGATGILLNLWEQLGKPRITALISSHYHSDHTSGIPTLQKRFGTRACLHPWVAKPIADHRRYDVPWLPAMDIRADELLPERGRWRWNEYDFRVAPFPGQTWWHAAYQCEIDGVKVFFGGDNFQPGSRWGGSGGYCAYNGSRFRQGFAKSARLVIDWAPDLLCNGHKCFFKFRPSRFRKIERWALRTEQVVKDLCPSGSLEKDYFLHDKGEPRTYTGV